MLEHSCVSCHIPPPFPPSQFNYPIVFNINIYRCSHIVYHEQNAAQLAICDGISGNDNTRCRTGTSTTIGKRGSAKFTLTATTEGATINVTKKRWEECVRAARDKCPTGTLTGTCLGGATSGDVLFTLESTMFAVQ